MLTAKALIDFFGNAEIPTSIEKEERDYLEEDREMRAILKGIDRSKPKRHYRPKRFMPHKLSEYTRIYFGLLLEQNPLTTTEIMRKGYATQKNITRVQETLDRMSKKSLPILNKETKKRWSGATWGRHYYKSNPEVIYAFFRRYSLSESEFERWKYENKYMLRRYKRSYKQIMKKLEQENLNFGSMLDVYMKQGLEILSTDLPIPTGMGKDNGIVGPGRVKGRVRERIFAMGENDLKIISGVRPHLFLTWMNFEKYIKDNEPSEEEVERILNWIFAHIMGWFKDRENRDIALEDVIDIDWIDNVEDHFLKEFPRWKEKVREVTADGWYDKLPVIQKI
ncbi:MAG TPA: hypothetical protein ENG66_08445 [Thermococcus sp.]|nr:hypothetical protein [Thermococcus sp.]